MFFLLDIGDAVGPVFPQRVQISVRKSHEPPAHGEQQIAADKRGGEDDQREAPFKIHQRGEDVLQESPLLADVLVRQVARAVFGNEARFVHAVPEHRLSGHPGDEPRQTELLRDDAFPRQHLLLRLPLLVPKKTAFSASLRTDAACPPAGKRSETREWFYLRRLSGTFRSEGSAPPPLRASEGWDDPRAPVDALPESGPAPTRTLLPSGAHPGSAQNYRHSLLWES